MLKRLVYATKYLYNGCSVSCISLGTEVIIRGRGYQIRVLFQGLPPQADEYRLPLASERRAYPL